MRVAVRAAAIALGLTLLGGPVLAQADLTGTGSGPLSTRTAPNTSAVGRTKPPSRTASPTARRDPDRRTANQRRMDKIDGGICDGC